MSAATETSNPSVRSALATKLREQWSICRDLRAGTAVLREKKARYLPRHEAEDLRDYRDRINLTVSVDYLDQTIQAFVGLALPQEIQLGKDTPSDLITQWENFDGAGNHGDVFWARFIEARLTDGIAGVIVEMPTSQAVPRRTRFDDVSSGVRPYAELIEAHRLVAWRHEVINLRRTLTMLVIEDTTEQPAGEFLTKPVYSYRVYRRVSVDATGQPLAAPVITWDLYEPSTDSGGQRVEYHKTDGGIIVGPTDIPFAGPLDGPPPLLGLAFANWRWLMVESDRAMSLYKTGVPMYVFTGKQSGLPAAPGADQSIRVSASYALTLEKGATASVLEPAGTSLAHSRLELQDWENVMSMSGLQMLQRDAGVQVTATERVIDKRQRQSKLGRIVRGVEDVAEQVLMFFAQYQNLPIDGIDVTIADDASAIDDATIKLMSDLQERGQLPLTTFLSILKRSGRMGNDFDPAAAADEVARTHALDPAYATMSGTESSATADPNAAATRQPMPAPTTDTGATNAAPTASADVVLNGAQITAAMDIVLAVAKGELPRDSGIGMLKAFFHLTDAQAEDIMGPAGTSTPTTPNPTGGGGAPPPIPPITPPVSPLN